MISETVSEADGGEQGWKGRPGKGRGAPGQWRGCFLQRKKTKESDALWEQLLVMITAICSGAERGLSSEGFWRRFIRKTTGREV